MAGDHSPWQANEQEVVELLWCYANMRHILAPPVPNAQESARDSFPSALQQGSEDVRQDPSETLPVRPPDESEQRVPVMVDPPKPDSQAQERTAKPTTERASPVRAPDPFPLPQPFVLGKALLPLAKRVPASVASELDIDKTVEQTAEADGLPLPAYCPPLKRWFDLHILVDRSPPMDFWGDLAEAVAMLFQWQGIFRDVRVWQLKTDRHEGPQLYAGGDPDETDIRSLLAPGRDQLFLVVTDTLGKAWRSGAAFKYLAFLGEKHHVALAHVFHKDLWHRTAMQDAILRPLVASHPGCANAKLRETVRVRTRQSLYRFPILNLSALHLNTWAKFVTGGGGSMQGVLIKQQPPTSDGQKQVEPSAGVMENETPEERLRAFNRDASPEARELATVLAAVPLIPPVMRLAQQQFLYGSEHWHLAEVFFSGLIRRSALGDPQAAVTDRWYEFIPGVRELLLNTSSVQQAAQVHREISTFVEEKYGSPRDFPALVPNEAGSEQTVEMDRHHYFAEVRGAILKTWGGEFARKGEEILNSAVAYRYRKQGQDLANKDSSDETEEQNFPSGVEVSDFEYVYPLSLPSEPTLIEAEVGSFKLVGGELIPKQKTVEGITFEVDTEHPTLKLETFLIRIAHIQRGKSDWLITYEESKAQCFQELVRGDITLEMVSTPAGTFMMGASKDEDGYSSEKPQHPVNVSAFYMSRYPVTQAQWRQVATMKPVEQMLKPNPSSFKGDLNPVERVSWYDAVEFCDRLSQRTGRNYRLPTEVEWEYACRAGTTTPFHLGEMITTELANYSGSAYREGPRGRSRDKTIPVTELNLANAFGLSDMHGNVWEWCLDHWHKNYDKAPMDGSAWLTNDENTDRILRGGSWDYDPWLCRSATRLHYSPDVTSSDIGFRIVLASR
ncbi:SAV_2336 N-terminal domain-related protein [Acaryochloris sp. IP29b_bin.148]|uniref:SAV_2336 N-terminal domain-related protein n=1 Tax=Acaryochloris sp. IP29b_bin.148 TaxID=2969218 RepID=UPI0026235F9B|nr:SAV_2336 N-terminal domain-related protein [Acaryochloris sp. IP29b_bin.148]